MLRSNNAVHTYLRKFQSRITIPEASFFCLPLAGGQEKSLRPIFSYSSGFLRPAGAHFFREAWAQKGDQENCLLEVAFWDWRIKPTKNSTGPGP